MGRQLVLIAALLPSVIHGQEIVWRGIFDFAARLDTIVADTYDSPPYPASPSPLSDIEMGYVLAETNYISTGFPNQNIVSGGTYCSGCSGSFVLQFDFFPASVSEPSSFYVGVNGVYGVGFIIASHDPTPAPYVASVIFGNGMTADYVMPTVMPPGAFWGITSPHLIVQISLGGPDGAVRTDGYFSLDVLYIGNAAPIFTDGFESGDTSKWALVSP